MIKKTIFVILFFFLLALASCTSYHYHYDDFEDDYYWAKDYYHSYDFYKTSSKTYFLNTYNNGKYFSNFEDYSDYLFYKNHPWLKAYVKDPKYYRYRDYDYRYDDYDFPGIKGSYVYYSPTLDKYKVEECYSVAPSNAIIYTKC